MNDIKKKAAVKKAVVKEQQRSDLQLGDLRVVDRGRFGVDFIDANGKMRAFVNARGAKALHRWLDDRFNADRGVRSTKKRG